MRKNPTATQIARRSATLNQKMEECALMMKSVNKFVQATESRIKKDKDLIERLTIENRSLRHSLKMKRLGGKIPKPLTTFPFIFPELPDSPQEILNRTVKEILPLEDNLDSTMKSARTRVLTLCALIQCKTVEELLRCDWKHEGPEWKYFLKYRNFGKVSLLVLSSALNHFKVDRANLPSVSREMATELMGD